MGEHVGIMWEPFGGSETPLVRSHACLKRGRPIIRSMLKVAYWVTRIRTMQQDLSSEKALRRRAAFAGFTLVELMVVMAVLAALAAMVAPSFRAIILSNRVAGAASAMQVSLSLARSEAVRRGADARVTVAANLASGQWANGWTVFLDKTSNANGAIAPTADSADVTRIEVVSNLDDVSFDQSGSLQYFSYNGLGRMVDATGAVVASRAFWFFSGESDRYCLIVNTTGRVRMAKVKSNETCATN